MNPRSWPAGLVLVTAAACGPSRPTQPGLVLQLEFENDCAVRASAHLASEVPSEGIYYERGIEGRAAHFDGSGAELRVRGLERLGLADSMTLEFFVKLSDWQNPYAAGGGLESFVSHSDNFTVAVDPHSGTLQARLRTTASADALRLSGGTLAPGAWHHVALILDGEEGVARLLLDGEEVDREPAEGALVIQPNLHLGVGTWFQKNQAFCGSLDSLQLWRRALDADDLAKRVALLTPESAGS